MSALGQKRTWISQAVMSALCQKQTLRTILDASETIVGFSSIGAAGGAEIPLVSSKDAIGRHVKTGGRETIRACQRPYNVCLPD